MDFSNKLTKWATIMDVLTVILMTGFGFYYTSKLLIGSAMVLLIMTIMGYQKWLIKKVFKRN